MLLTMKNEAPVIQNVSDTALWVAFYRSRETESKNPLFRDPLAKKLVGERGEIIDKAMGSSSTRAEYNVLIRTVIIDRFIQALLDRGVDCVINMGAGLDTRPYRLKLPKNLKWIEVDYPNIIDLKNQKLAQDTPSCDLSRVALDLNDRESRKRFLAGVNGKYQKIAVLTEGVLPYLTEDQVTSLAEDLTAQNQIQFWIVDYISPLIYKYLKTPKRTQQMKNAPFHFTPPDWFGFFKDRKWEPKTIEYLPEEGVKLGRRMPMPLVAKIVGPFLSAETKKKFLQSSGYMIMERG